MKKYCWQNVVIASILAVGVLTLLFWLRIQLGDLAIYLGPLLGGCACGAVISGVSLGLKRKAVPLIGAAVFYLVCFLVPGTSVFTSIFVGCASVCCLAGIPFYAALLGRVPGGQAA